MGGTRHPLVVGCQVTSGSFYHLQLALLKATRASMTLTVSFIAAFQCFALGKPTRGQAEQNGRLPGSGELSHQTLIPSVLRSRLRNPLAAHGGLKTADSCCQNIISIWAYTITARQQVPLCLQSARPHK